MSATASRVRAGTRAPRTTSKQRLRLWLRLLRARAPSKARSVSGCVSRFRMTLPQFDVLAALARADAGMTMTELSRLLMVSNGNVTGIIERLAADGLVPGRPRPGIAAPFTSASPRRGIDTFARMATIHETWVDELLSDFTRADTEVLIAHLDGLAGRIREGGRRV